MVCIITQHKNHSFHNFNACVKVFFAELSPSFFPQVSKIFGKIISCSLQKQKQKNDADCILASFFAIRSVVFYIVSKLKFRGLPEVQKEDVLIIMAQSRSNCH